MEVTTAACTLTGMIIMAMVEAMEWIVMDMDEAMEWIAMDMDVVTTTVTITMDMMQVAATLTNALVGTMVMADMDDTAMEVLA